MSLVLAPPNAPRQIGLSGQLQTHKQGLVHAKGAASLFWVEAVVAGTLLNVLIESGSSGCLISGRLANSLRLVQAPCKDPVGSDVVGVNGQSFCPTGEVNLLLEIGGLASMETVIVAPNLPVPFLLGGDYLWRHRCLADYFNAQFLTRADPQVGLEHDTTMTSQPLEDARSQGTLSCPSALSSSPGGS